MASYWEMKKRKVEKSLLRFFKMLNSEKNVGHLSTIGTVAPYHFRRSIVLPAKEAVVVQEGKRMSPVITYLSHDIVEGSSEHIDDLAIFPELLHKGSLVVDDIEDGAITRHSDQPLYMTRGMPVALNAGNFLYLAGTILLDRAKLDEKAELEIYKAFANEWRNAHIGQGLDLVWRNPEVIPTESEYLQMCAYKTAVCRFAAKLGAVLGKASEEQTQSLVDIAELAATSYQLKDDIAGLDPEDQGYGDDIVNGAYNLMVIKTIADNGADGERLRSILASEDKRPLVEEAVSIMNESGAVQEVGILAAHLAGRAQETLHRNFSEFETTQEYSAFIAQLTK